MFLAALGVINDDYDDEFYAEDNKLCLEMKSGNVCRTTLV